LYKAAWPLAFSKCIQVLKDTVSPINAGYQLGLCQKPEVLFHFVDIITTKSGENEV